jgi:hypothetical protein
LRVFFYDDEKCFMSLFETTTAAGMNLLEIAGDVWRANEQFIHSTIELGGSVVNVRV